MEHQDIILNNHPLIGHEVEGYGKHYIVEKVVKQYYKGWYIVLLIEQNNSHDVVYWKNIDCTSKVILKSIERSEKEYTIH